jgi:hypothetical protein
VRPICRSSRSASSVFEAGKRGEWTNRLAAPHLASAFAGCRHTVPARLPLGARAADQTATLSSPLRFRLALEAGAGRSGATSAADAAIRAQHRHLGKRNSLESAGWQAPHQRRLPAPRCSAPRQRPQIRQRCPLSAATVSQSRQGRRLASGRCLAPGKARGGSCRTPPIACERSTFAWQACRRPYLLIC